jgi:hypothetical protein
MISGAIANWFGKGARGYGFLLQPNANDTIHATSISRSAGTSYWYPVLTGVIMIENREIVYEY